MGLHIACFSVYFVQNKVTEIVALVLGRLKYKMIFLLQGIRGRGESHPVYSDIHVVESPHHKSAMLGSRALNGVGGGGSRIGTRVCLVLEPEGTQAHDPSLAFRRNAGRERCPCNHSTHRFTNGSGSDLKGVEELSFPFHIKRKKRGGRE